MWQAKMAKSAWGDWVPKQIPFLGNCEDGESHEDDQPNGVLPKKKCRKLPAKAGACSGGPGRRGMTLRMPLLVSIFWAWERMGSPLQTLIGALERDPL